MSEETKEQPEKPVEKDYDIVKEELLPLHFRPATSEEKKKMSDKLVNMLLDFQRNHIKMLIEKGTPNAKEQTPEQINETREFAAQSWEKASMMVYEIDPDNWLVLILNKIEFTVRCGEKFIRYKNLLVDTDCRFEKYGESHFYDQ